jgi:hypothetical protein
MTEFEYNMKMLDLVYKCIKRGFHNYVHGQYTIYCWDCFHNGTIGYINGNTYIREILASSVKLDLIQMRRMLQYPYKNHVVPKEYIKILY